MIRLQFSCTVTVYVAALWVLQFQDAAVHRQNIDETEHVDDRQLSSLPELNVFSFVNVLTVFGAA